MHNRKRLFVLILTILVALPLLAACGEDTGPTETLEAAVQNLKDGDWQGLTELTTDPATLDDSEMAEEGAELLKAMTHHLNIEVLEQSINGDRATIDARVTNVSMPGVFQEFLTFGNALMYGLMGEEGEDAMMTAIVENVRQDDAPTRTEDVTVDFRKVDGDWRLYVGPDFDDNAPAFWNALLGYMADL